MILFDDGKTTHIFRDFKDALLSINPPIPPPVELLEEDEISIYSYDLQQLTEAARKYLTVHKSHLIFVGIQFVNKNSIKISAANLNRENSRHGYGNSDLNLEYIIVYIEELFT